MSVLHLRWEEEFNKANSAIHNREELVSMVYNKLEHDYDLQGCTAIEDKLQARVPETIYVSRIDMWPAANLF